MSRKFSRMVALRYRDFRFLWIGEMAATAGRQMQLFAVNWHVFELLRGQSFTLSLFGNAIEMGSEAFGLGLLGLTRVIPVLLFALAGGLLADRFDRRSVMLMMRLLAALVALALAALTVADRIDVGMIYALTALGAAAITLDFPARQSIEANLVAARHLSNAISLNMLVTKIATVLAPALAGLLLASFNIGLVYAIGAAAFLAGAASIGGIRQRGKRTRPARINWRTLVLGIRFTFGKRIIMGTMLLDFFATFLASARTLLPIVAGDILGLGAFGYGMLATAQPVGGLLAGLFLSLRAELKRQGVVFLVCVAIYGLATAVFGLSTSIVLSYLVFAMTGAADIISSVIRGTIRQLMTPDKLRGRMVSVNMLFFMTGPQLGELRAGIAASILGAPLAIFGGGLAAALLAALVAWRFPSIRRFDSAADLKRKPARGRD
ncbi:MAG: MFS transporter [Chloroflexi bacterium]|nr:MFS transporter [Chloroflexota bacterium]